MKSTNHHYFLLSIVLLLGLVSCKPSPEKAMEYYNKTLDCEQAVLEKEDALNILINKEMKKTLADSGSANIPQTSDTFDNRGFIDAAYAEFCAQIKQSQQQLKEIGGFDNKTELYDVSSSLLETYRTLSEKEYKEVVEIAKTPPSVYTSDDDNRFFDLTGHIDTTLQNQIDQFTKVCKSFAREYQFEIEDPRETNPIH
jgi:hypothetical protein